VWWLPPHIPSSMFFPVLSPFYYEILLSTSLLFRVLLWHPSGHMSISGLRIILCFSVQLKFNSKTEIVSQMKIMWPKISVVIVGWYWQAFVLSSSMCKYICRHLQNHI
jgi:hypothetical protein